MRPNGARLRCLLLGSVILAALLSACSPSNAAPPASASAPVVVTSPPGATPSATSSTGFQKEALSPDPNFDTGHTIQITSSGFHPAILVSPCCDAITWRNMTSTAVTVVFDAVLGGSAMPIPPGGIYVFVPGNVESIAYHSGSDLAIKGAVQVNQLPV